MKTRQILLSLGLGAAVLAVTAAPQKTAGNREGKTVRTIGQKIEERQTEEKEDWRKKVLENYAPSKQGSPNASEAENPEEDIDKLLLRVADLEKQQDEVKTKIERAAKGSQKTIELEQKSILVELELEQKEIEREIRDLEDKR